MVRVGIRIATFEACSGFTHVTAHGLAQPPKATFVTRLQPIGYPNELLVSYSIKPATIEVESSSTGNTRLQGALCKIALRGGSACATAPKRFCARRQRIDWRRCTPYDFVTRGQTLGGIFFSASPI